MDSTEKMLKEMYINDLKEDIVEHIDAMRQEKKNLKIKVLKFIIKYLRLNHMTSINIRCSNIRYWPRGGGYDPAHILYFKNIFIDENEKELRKILKFNLECPGEEGLSPREQESYLLSELTFDENLYDLFSIFSWIKRISENPYEYENIL